MLFERIERNRLRTRTSSKKQSKVLIQGSELKYSDCSLARTKLLISFYTLSESEVTYSDSLLLKRFVISILGANSNIYVYGSGTPARPQSLNNRIRFLKFLPLLQQTIVNFKIACVFRFSLCESTLSSSKQASISSSPSSSSSLGLRVF